MAGFEIFEKLCNILGQGLFTLFDIMAKFFDSITLCVPVPAKSILCITDTCQLLVTHLTLVFPYPLLCFPVPAKSI